MGVLRRIGRLLASLRLTVVLLGLAMVLILAGTLAQVDEGVWTVVDRYFRSSYVVIPFQLFVPKTVARVPGATLFPGGLTLGVLLLVNLLAAHAVRFKPSWKRAGIILTHAGVILLLVGEFVTGAAAREGNMSIDEGEVASFVEDIRSAELVVVDSSGADSDLEITVPGSMLARGGTIEHGLLPFAVRVDEWMPNSNILGPAQAGTERRARATQGPGTSLAAVAAPRATGVQGNEVDVPSAYVTVLDGDGVVGTCLVSVHLVGTQTLSVRGREYGLALRFTRTYKPYSVELIDFRHDKFVGSDRPRNFSSLVRLRDPARNVDREVLIRMNEPLRYSGDTLYQSAFKPGDRGTILQVVRNPGWLIPYASCVMVTLGMLVHFGVRLVGGARRGGA